MKNHIYIGMRDKLFNDYLVTYMQKKVFDSVKNEKKNHMMTLIYIYIYTHTHVYEWNSLFIHI
jgi:hypothetical protein